MAKDTNEQTNEITTTRVYKYGVVFDMPVARDFPQEAINELFKANQLWNQFVHTHRVHQDFYDQARRDASPEYRVLAEAIDHLNEQIKQAYDQDLTKARQVNNTRDKNDPHIKKVTDEIKELKRQRKNIYETIKPIRGQIKDLIDAKSLEQAFWDDIKLASKVKNSDIDSTIANEIQRYFKIARSKAFADRATLRFHKFDGTGFWHWRLRYSEAHAGKKVTADGVKWQDLFTYTEGNKELSALNSKRFVLLYEKEIGAPVGTRMNRGSLKKKAKTVIRARATMAGKLKTALNLEFDLHVHRPIPENGQIQNVKMIRTRTGDQFKYHACFTVKFPTPAAPYFDSKQAIGIDIGFREQKEASGIRNKYNLLKVAHIAYSDSDMESREVLFSEKMVDKANWFVELQSDLSNSATELGFKLKPLLKGVILPKDFERRETREKQINAIKNMRSNVTLSAEQAYKLAKWVRFDRASDQSIFPESVRKLTDAWLTENENDYKAMYGLRRRLLAWRDEMYRIEAARLVAEKKIIVVENIKYSKMIEVEKGDTDLSNRARANRFLAAPAKFIEIVKNAAEREQIPFIKVNPKNTSKTCSVCEVVNEDLKAEETWTCQCGQKHNRDENAAINIARIGLDKWKK